MLYNIAVEGVVLALMIYNVPESYALTCYKGGSDNADVVGKGAQKAPVSTACDSGVTHCKMVVKGIH